MDVACGLPDRGRLERSDLRPRPFCDMLAPSGSSHQFGFYVSDAPRDALGTYSFQRKIDSNSIGASATHFLPVAPLETASARRLRRLSAFFSDAVPDRALTTSRSVSGGHSPSRRPLVFDLLLVYFGQPSALT